MGHVMKDNPKLFEGIDFDNLVQKTALAGRGVLTRKGSTQFGIAAAATAIVKALIRDENRILTVSTYLDGEMGAQDVFLGVPTILGKEGVIDVVNLHLTPEEQEKFDESARIIRNNINEHLDID